MSTPRIPKVVSEPWYRGSSLFGNALLFSIILFVVDVIENDAEGINWMVNTMPVLTILLMLMISKRQHINREDTE